VVDGQTLTFEVFGLLQDVFTMVDRETGTLWTHLDGKAIQGPLNGKRLDFIAVPHMTWADWQASHPDTTVLSPDTPFQDRYRPVQIGVFSRQEELFGDGRLAANALVVGVEVDGLFKGYSVEALAEAGGVVNDTLASQPIVVFYDASARTGLAFSRTVDGQLLELYNAAPQGFELRDRQTGSLWNIEGRAISGPLAGTALEFVPSFISEWYGWSAYHPESELFQG
jgi:hypothetical protein